ncbi:hypothetical protein ACFSBF_01160 [Sphingobacterium suaedae]|uniref:hypothetical protein n=1 Tax=Sphingobacterium suaedae TaxID=1686402 RepID=UPI003639CF4D
MKIWTHALLLWRIPPSGISACSQTQTLTRIMYEIAFHPSGHDGTAVMNATHQV